MWLSLWRLLKHLLLHFGLMNSKRGKTSFQHLINSYQGLRIYHLSNLPHYLDCTWPFPSLRFTFAYFTCDTCDTFHTCRHQHQGKKVRGRDEQNDSFNISKDPRDQKNELKKLSLGFIERSRNPTCRNFGVHVLDIYAARSIEICAFVCSYWQLMPIWASSPIEGAPLGPSVALTFPWKYKMVDWTHPVLVRTVLPKI